MIIRNRFSTSCMNQIPAVRHLDNTILVTFCCSSSSYILERLEARETYICRAMIHRSKVGTVFLEVSKFICNAKVNILSLLDDAAPEQIRCDIIQTR